MSGAHGKKKNWVSSVQVYLLQVDISMFQFLNETMFH
jgi:hypothetical protein